MSDFSSPPVPTLGHPTSQKIDVHQADAPKIDAQYDWVTHRWGGWFLAGVLDSAVHLVRTWGAPPALARWDAHLIGLGRHLALGYCAAGAYWLARRWLSLRAGLIIWGAVATGLAALVVPRDLGGFAARLGKMAGLPAEVVLGAFAVCIGGLMPLVALSTYTATRSKWRWLQWGLVFGGAALATLANVNVSPGLNPSAHLFLSWLTAVLLGRVAVAAGQWARGALRGRVPRGPRLIAYQVPLGLAVWSCLGPNANGAWLAYVRRPHQLIASAFVKTSRGPNEIDPSYAPKSEYFVSRASAGDVPPSPGSRPPHPVVLMLTFDSFRADVATQPEYHEYLPNFQALRKRSAFFTRAYAPASRTVNTLASIATGTYFSQQRWTESGTGLSLASDVTPQFPEALTSAGVDARFYPAIEQLAEEHGPFKGFSRNTFPASADPRSFVDGETLTAQLLSALESEPEKSWFLWVHYLDSHVPYAAGNPESDSFRRYLRALKVTDGYLGRVMSAVERLKIAERTYIIVSADHGEAFGEHGSWHHGTTLYNEQMQVPLLVSGPDVLPRTVETPVSLIDLGATILDLNGLPTPGVHLGETLLPSLRGQVSSFRRPIVSETGLKRCMVFEDSRKLIRDWQYDTLELYDLSNDPHELHDLADIADTSGYLAHLRQFFAAHPHHSSNYRVFHNK